MTEFTSSDWNSEKGEDQPEFGFLSFPFEMGIFGFVADSVVSCDVFLETVL